MATVHAFSERCGSLGRWSDDRAGLRETARRFPQRDAFVFCNPLVRMTWAEFDATVDRVSRGLLALGFVPGDHFGVWATNVPEWVLLQFATARIGVVLVNINPAYRTSELKYALRQSDVRGLALIDTFKSSNYFEMINEACPELAASAPGELQSETFPKLQWVVSLRGDTPPGMLSWDELLAKGEGVPQEQLEEVAAGLSPHDPINIQYTSGTTGNPKGAMLSHRNILLNGFYAGDRQRLTEKDRVCLPVPLYHCFGCVLGTLCCVAHGSAMVFPAESFNPCATLAAIEQERCTALYGVPTMFIAQLEHEDYRRRDLSSLRTGIMSGSPCPIETMKRVTHEMGAREITCGYGQTEMSPLMTQTRTDDPLELRVGTVGRPLPGVEVKIVDVETGEDLGDGQAGEICGRGHGVMIGYYNMPEKTAEAIDAERLAAHGRPRPARAERLLPHHGPAARHDHPRRREHLSARDRRAAVPAPGGGGSASGRRAGSGVGARKCWRGSSSSATSRRRKTSCASSAGSRWRISRRRGTGSLWTVFRRRLPGRFRSSRFASRRSRTWACRMWRRLKRRDVQDKQFHAERRALRIGTLITQSLMSTISVD